MKQKIVLFLKNLLAAVRLHPVEVFLALAFSVLSCYCFEEHYVEDIIDMLFYYPVFFIITYIFNRVLTGKTRVLYYLSALFPTLLIGLELKVPSATWAVSVLVMILLYFVSFKEKDNELFVERVLSLGRSILSAGALTFVAWLLSVSIYYSIVYIFEIGKSQEQRFLTYAACTAGFGLLSLLLLYFNQNQRFGKQESRVFEILFNYVLTPALLIYTLILYLYFIKVAVTWSLPKGGVALIVISFSIAVFALRGCMPFLEKLYYRWFYKYASWVVLPTLVIYWIGCVYRINEYGFTEPRVYLIVAGIILTGVDCLFFSKRWGRYLYAAILAIFMLSIVTYIPGITAKDIETYSQANIHQSEDNTIEADTRDRYVMLENTFPIEIAGYQTIQRIETYNKDKGMWMQQTADSLVVYNEDGSVLYNESLDKLFKDQFSKVGIAMGDTIPDSVYPDLLRLNLPTGAIVFDRISIKREPDYSTYYVSGGYYLDK